jgi:hypothetical protein
MLEASRESSDAFDGLIRFLTTHAGSRVVLSAESLTNWLAAGEKQDAFLRLLAVAREAVPTRCIWTLRRLDDMLHSLYLLRLARDSGTPPPDEHFAAVSAPDAFFAGMRRVEDAVEDVAYVRYDLAGGHNHELLRAFDMSADLANEIERGIAHGARRNAALTCKQAAALLNLDQLSRSLGTRLDATSLRVALRRGELSFEQDSLCEVIGSETRQALHESALEAARAHGFAPYIEFFGEEDAEPRAAVCTTLEVLTDSDLELLSSVGSRASTAT